MNRTHLLILNIFLFSILSSDFLLAVQPAPANDTITMDILMFQRKNAKSKSIFRHQWLIKGEEVVCFLKKDKKTFKLNKKWQAKIEKWQIGVRKNSKGRASYFLVKRK